MADTVSLLIRKCSCGSVWCPDCFKRYRLPEIRALLSSWEFDKIRHVVLTLDRKKFESAEQGLEWGRKKLAYVVKDLKRTGGVEIEGYISFLEWHKDGFPHWHCLFLVKDRGKAGMIGGGLIREYWTAGAVHESYFKTQKDYDGVVGYFQKMGYFEKTKKHQGRLPVWVLDKGIRVKRVSRSLGQKREKRENDGPGRRRVRGGSGWRGYREVLKSCGACSFVDVAYRGLLFGTYKVAVAYREARKWAGEWVEGLGYKVRVDRRKFLTWAKRFDSFKETLAFDVVWGYKIQLGGE